MNRTLAARVLVLIGCSWIGCASAAAQGAAPASPPVVSRILEARRLEAAPARIGMGAFLGQGEANAPTGRFWLHLRVQLNSPRKDYWLPLKQIKLREGGSDATSSISGVGIHGKDAFRFHIFQQTVVEIPEVGSTGTSETDLYSQREDAPLASWKLLRQKDETGFLLLKPGALEADLLFSVSVDSTGLTLETPDGSKLPVSLATASK